MGSLVAEQYFSEKGVFLVGDAAHVFPPAGGFGMNTGLQDVYSLA
jgi:2-polyprenyl-6-methoxyphenol hydroxylase-like FAD-dependent oxidoreductase